MELKAAPSPRATPAVPNGWSSNPIGQIGPLQRGFDLPNRDIRPGSFPIVYSNGVDGFHCKAMTAGPGVVTGRSGTIGRVHFIESAFWPHNTSLWVTRFNGNDPKFVFYLYDFIGFGRFASGSGVPTLNRNDVHSFDVAIPDSPAEQQAISRALTDVDALLAGLDRLIAKKRDLKQAAMQQLLTGQTRLPGFEGEWEVTQLGRIAKIQRGASPRPIEDPIWFDENSSVGWVRISDVTRSGMFLDETTQRLSSIGVDHSRPVSSGSLIMSICATVGRPVITRIDVCIHDGFVVFDGLNADQRFVYYVLKWLEPTWSKHGQTGSQMNLNTGLINGAEILLPLRDEQAAIAAVLSDMDLEMTTLEARRDKTRALKQGMMQELLTGRTRLV